MNKPYVKQVNDLGEIINPITSIYSSSFPNRRKRREKTKRFVKNTNTKHYTVLGIDKYERVAQVIKEYDRIHHKFKVIKIIYHYLDYKPKQKNHESENN